jgi:hypothetical protein
MGYSPTTFRLTLRKLDSTLENNALLILKSSISSASWITPQKKHLERMPRAQAMVVRQRHWLQLRNGEKICMYFFSWLDDFFLRLAVCLVWF